MIIFFMRITRDEIFSSWPPHLFLEEEKAKKISKTIKIIFVIHVRGEKDESGKSSMECLINQSREISTATKATRLIKNEL